MEVQVPVSLLFVSDAGEEFIHGHSNGLVVLLAVVVSVSEVSLCFTTLNHGEQGHQVLGLVVGDSPSRHAFSSECLRVEGNLLLLAIFSNVFGGCFFNNFIALFVKLFNLLNDLFHREFFILNFVTVRHFFLAESEGYDRVDRS